MKNIKKFEGVFSELQYEWDPTYDDAAQLAKYIESKLEIDSTVMVKEMPTEHNYIIYIKKCSAMQRDSTCMVMIKPDVFEVHIFSKSGAGTTYDDYITWRMELTNNENKFTSWEEVYDHFHIIVEQWYQTYLEIENFKQLIQKKFNTFVTPIAFGLDRYIV